MTARLPRTRTCEACGQDFERTKGAQVVCPECKPARRRAQTNASNRLWRQRHPGAATRKEKGWHSKWRAENPDQAREHSLRQRHGGLTLAGRAAIAAADGGNCPICRKPTDGKMEVDHDHGCCPGKRSCGHCIRGVVHHRCNIVLDEAIKLGCSHPYVTAAPARMARNDAIRIRYLDSRAPRGAAA